MKNIGNLRDHVESETTTMLITQKQEKKEETLTIKMKKSPGEKHAHKKIEA